MLVFELVETKSADRARLPSDTSVEADTCGVEFVNEENVAHVLAAMPDEDTLDRTASEFSLLADPTRLRILYARVCSAGRCPRRRSSSSGCDGKAL